MDMAEEEGLQRATPWLSDFAGGFWAGLEPMFLLTFLIATLGSLCFMCAILDYLSKLPAASAVARRRSGTDFCYLTPPQRHAGLGSSPSRRSNC